MRVAPLALRLCSRCRCSVQHGSAPRTTVGARPRGSDVIGVPAMVGFWPPTLREIRRSRATARTFQQLAARNRERDRRHRHGGDARPCQIDRASSDARAARVRRNSSGVYRGVRRHYRVGSTCRTRAKRDTVNAGLPGVILGTTRFGRRPACLADDTGPLRRSPPRPDYRLGRVGGMLSRRPCTRELPVLDRHIEDAVAARRSGGYWAVRLTALSPAMRYLPAFRARRYVRRGDTPDRRMRGTSCSHGPTTSCSPPRRHRGPSTSSELAS